MSALLSGPPMQCVSPTLQCVSPAHSPLLLAACHEKRQHESTERAEAETCCHQRAAGWTSWVCCLHVLLLLCIVTNKQLVLQLRSHR